MARPGTLLTLAAAFMLTIPMLRIGTASAAGEKKVEVRFSAYYPEHYPVFKNGWLPWEEMVEKESRGTFTFKNYLNGVLHAAKHGFRATSTDVCDITTGYPGYQRSSFHLSHVNDLPFFFANTYIGPIVSG
jgi:TRAP-type C4-dicarboxylate transport system substrate-binding protein